MAPQYLGNGLTKVEKIPDVPIRELSKTNVKIDSPEITTGTWNIAHFVLGFFPLPNNLGRLSNQCYTDDDRCTPILLEMSLE